MDIKIEVGDYEVISNGSIIVENGSDLHFTIDDLKFTFQFTKDDTNEAQRVQLDLKQGEEQGSKSLIVKLINHHARLNSGNRSMFDLAYINNRRLALKYRVTSVGNENFDFIFQYTWYLKKEETEND
ncbi:hypothetical protein EYV94_15285 [Puteibacter caeruleilacunae]|nr:hypothetical protein EYV94_15285 [Puteibacter caeruleilacunae]